MTPFLSTTLVWRSRHNANAVGSCGWVKKKMSITLTIKYHLKKTNVNSRNEVTANAKFSQYACAKLLSSYTLWPHVALAKMIVDCEAGNSLVYSQFVVRKERDNAARKLNRGIKPRKRWAFFSCPSLIVFSFEWLHHETRTKNTPKNPPASETKRIVLMGMIMTKH